MSFLKNLAKGITSEIGSSLEKSARRNESRSKSGDLSDEQKEILKERAAREREGAANFKGMSKKIDNADE